MTEEAVCGPLSLVRLKQIYLYCVSRRDNLLHPDDGGGGGRRGGNNGDEEDDEGTVSDPSPSPQIPINSSAQNYASTAGRCIENSLLSISQCLRL